MSTRCRSVKVKMVVDSAARALVLAACLAGTTRPIQAAPVAVEVRLIQTPEGRTYFDPVGVRIAPGDTIRWVQLSGFHSISAYHPSNDNHELRIPASAQPWDSDILLADRPKPGSTFEHVFTVPGVYDYFCKPHEAAGMVGRVIVGDPGDGPGTKPFGYASGKNWKPIPEAARKILPSVAEIMQKGAVRVP